MTHTYQIDGMHCGSCITKVKSELLKLADVTEADVQLTSPQATISMSQLISLGSLQKAIDKAGKFTIKELEANDHRHQKGQEKAKVQGWLATYKPLLIAFAYIIAIATLTSRSPAGIDWMKWMNNFMGGFFIILSFFKLLDLYAFAESYNSYDLLAKRVRAYGFIYPFIELGLGIAYIMEWSPFYHHNSRDGL